MPRIINVKFDGGMYEQENFEQRTEEDGYHPQ